MQTPRQAARRNRDAGARLPQPWASAAQASADFRRGQLSMMVAAPGVGKSIFANAYAVLSGVRTLYMSMDTDPFTTSVRLVAMCSGRTMNESEKGLGRGEPWAVEALDGARNMTLAFPTSPNDEEIQDRLIAYRESAGEFPDLLVIDNLGNVSTGEDEFGGMSRMLRDLQAVCMKTGVAILVLHHATGEHETGDTPIPLSGVRGKVSKFPAMILTAHNAGMGRMGISVVKNRFGPADPSGNLVYHLNADLERARLSDHDERNVGMESFV